MARSQLKSANRVVPTSAVEDETPQSRGALAPYQIVLTLALVLTFVAYIGTLGFPFVSDDRGQIVENPWIQSWRFVPRYFTHHVWGGILPEVFVNYYRPVFLLWLRVNYTMFGLDPRGWHLTSILLHLVVTLLVYVLTSRLFADRLSAALASMVFGLHPIHIESVAWVSGVTEPLMAVLLIPSFLCYLKYEEQGSRCRLWLAGSLFLCLVAMFSKETALILPMIIFVYEWIFWADPREATGRGDWARRFRNALRCATPYLALIPLYLIARILALKALSRTITPLPFSTIVFTWPSLLWHYLKLLVWPVGLSPFYGTPYVTRPGFLNVGLPLAALCAATLILWAWARRPGPGLLLESDTARPRIVAFASMWLVLPVIPLLNLRVLPQDDIAHDRYMYLPSVGFAMIAALAMQEIRIGRGRRIRREAAQVAVTLIVAALFVIGTVFQSVAWADDLLIYHRGVAAGLNKKFLDTNLANILAERGYYDDAIKIYQRVLVRYPAYWSANYNLGYTYYRLGKLQEAEFYFKRAIAIDSAMGDQFLYLGLTHFKMSRLDEAAAELRQAIRIHPDASGYHFALGVVLKMQGNLAGALEEFKAELVNNPKEQAARDQIAEVEMRMLGSRAEGQGRARFSSPTTESSR